MSKFNRALRTVILLLIGLGVISESVHGFRYESQPEFASKKSCRNTPKFPAGGYSFNYKNNWLVANQNAFLQVSLTEINRSDNYAKISSRENLVKISDGLIKKYGLDPHQIKRNCLGNKAKIARFDLYRDTKTHEILILEKGGKGVPIYTGEYLK